MFDNQRPATAQERTAIVEYIKNTFFDPYSIRDAQISSIVEGTGLDSSKTHMACMIANAKNRMGGYVGKRALLYYFGPDGQIARSADSTDDVFVNPFCLDSRLQYVPFPETEGKTS